MGTKIVVLPLSFSVMLVGYGLMCSVLAQEYHREDKKAKTSVREPQTGMARVEVTIHRLIEKLKDPDGNTRSAAIDELVHIGEPAVDPLIRSLKDQNEYVRSCAAIALGKIKNRRSVEPLIATLSDSDEFVLRGAALGLGMIGDQKAIGPLIKLLEDELVSLPKDHSEKHIESARCTAKALEMITGKNYGFNYKEWKKWWHENKETWKKENKLVEGNENRRNPTEAERTAEIETLVTELSDKDVYKQSIATFKLIRIGKLAVQPLIRELRNGDKTACPYIIQALGKIGDKKAIQPLIDVLKDGNKNVRRLSAEALKEITNQDFGQDYQEWKHWWYRHEKLLNEKEEVDKKILYFAAELCSLDGIDHLVKLGTPAIEPLIELLRTKNPYGWDSIPSNNAYQKELQHIRKNAALALKKITGKDFGESHEKWKEWWKEDRDK